MNITEYELSGRELYVEFCEVIKRLLNQAIENDGRYRLEHIQSRAKDVDSLRARLEQEGKIESEEIEKIRKDLAGCRIIFYTNNDVSRFTRSPILSSLFEVDWKRSKIHQPRPDN